MESKKIIGYWHYGILLTYAAFTLGVVSIVFSALGRAGIATICILFAGLFDAFDGIVARTRKNRTPEDKQFGIQIDSLSDLVAFGIAPVFVGFAMGMREWYYIIVFCLYALCAIVRLGYFNVDEIFRQISVDAPTTGGDTSAVADANTVQDGSRKYYTGMPVTQISLIIPIFYFVATMFENIYVQHGIMLFLYVVYAALMVLRFKIRKPHGKWLIIMIVLFLSAILATFLVRWFAIGNHVL